MSTEGKKNKCLTHTEFYAVCECMKKNKQMFLDGRPTFQQAAELLSKLSNVLVGKRTIADLQKATGVVWEPKRVVKDSSMRSNSIRTLTVALHRLYRKLSEEPPESLDNLFKLLTDKEQTKE